MAKQKTVKIPDEIFSSQFLKFAGLYADKFKASNGYGKWLVEYQRMEDTGMFKPEALKKLYIGMLNGSSTESYIIKDAVNYICSQALDATKAYISTNLFDIKVITGEIAVNDDDEELINLSLEEALDMCKAMNDEAEELLFKVYYHNTNKLYRYAK